MRCAVDLHACGPHGGQDAHLRHTHTLTRLEYHIALPEQGRVRVRGQGPGFGCRVRVRDWSGSRVRVQG